MNKFERQMAAWKAQQAMEVAAEEARAAKLETYIDIELQQRNQEDLAEQHYLARRADTQRVLTAWEAVKADLFIEYPKE